MNASTPHDAPGSPWDDLPAYVALPRLTGLALSPDGTRLVASVSALNSEGNAFSTALWAIDREGAAPARRLTRGVEGEAVAAFLRDGSLLFTGKRAVPAQGDDPVKDTTKALWCLPADGGEAYVLARRDGGWEAILPAKATDTVALAVPTHPGVADEAADAAKREARAKAKVTAILHAGVPVRFWDHDLGAEMTRLLVGAVGTGEGDAALGEVRALSGDVGDRIGEPYSLSDDGRVLVTGWLTDRDHGHRWDATAVWDVASGERTVLTEADLFVEQARVSPDGRLVAAVVTTRFTADRACDSWLAVFDLATGERRDLARDWDRWPMGPVWSPDSGTVYVTADDQGDSPVFAVDATTGGLRRLTGDGAYGSVVVAPEGTLFALRSSYTDPGSVVRIDPAGGDVRTLPAPVDYPAVPGRLERVSCAASDGVEVSGYLALPADASGERPAKLALWIHGGPLGSWNAWSWRWCPWLLVSQGYAVLLPDPALSTGYGWEFIQRGWGRWGAAPYTDLMAITDAVEARPDVDASRTVAMGGSFGGYMVNWVAGHTDRFAAIVSHASLWNLSSFGATTDFPWYWNDELSPEAQVEFSPHRFADQITTPMLVVHGDKDYRVPIGEGLALWWALVSGWDGAPEDLPHRFLYFPDENHWVLTPNHARVWYETVRSFLATHVDGAPEVRSELL